MPSKTRILVVTESREHVYALEQILGREELEIVVARTDDEALAAVAKYKFALAIMEQAPGVEGCKLAASMRELDNFRHVPIIFITPGYISPSWMFQGYDLGAVDFVVSPWEPFILSSKVSTFVTIERLKRQLQLSEQGMEAMAHELKSVSDRLMTKERELATASSLDKLTGLPNRLRVAEILHSEWLRMAREQKSLAMLFIDVDHLRLFSEHYGQGAEERCMRRIATALDASFRRPGDILGRFGAEKFGAILPDTDIAGTTHIAENACAAIRALDIEHAASPVSNIVTVSIGAGSVRPGPGCTAADLIQAADKALYKAKLAGRNRVAYSQCEPSECVSV